ncbi:MAG TPA: radical SAM protein [Bacteroidales bacterium]|nr:radical SAM protein [Bacteroidales bacterium]
MEPLGELRDCAICPRQCHADRFETKSGYCRSGAGFNISSVCIHRGEEPAISGREGICNIFFTNCNLQCIYCQNWQISKVSHDRRDTELELEEVLRQITAILDSGVRRVGFVSPSHFIPQVKVIIRCIHALGYRPVWVFNTNGYDRAETLRSLEGMIHVYLPDLKYMDTGLASAYSDAVDYPSVAGAALKEMFRQKGAALHLAEDGTAESGIIVRHLVLPGQTENSIAVLRFLARELSPAIHISLMSQYYPTPAVSCHPELKRTVRKTEYERVVSEMEELGMHRGWIQELESSGHYRPDFDKIHPFDG